MRELFYICMCVCAWCVCVCVCVCIIYIYVCVIHTHTHTHIHTYTHTHTWIQTWTLGRDDGVNEEAAARAQLLDQQQRTEESERPQAGTEESERR